MLCDILSALIFVYFKDIAHTYLGMYQFWLKVLIQFFTQEVDINVNRLD